MSERAHNFLYTFPCSFKADFSFVFCFPESALHWEPPSVVILCRWLVDEKQTEDQSNIERPGRHSKEICIRMWMESFRITCRCQGMSWMARNLCRSNVLTSFDEGYIVVTFPSIRSLQVLVNRSQSNSSPLVSTQHHVERSCSFGWKGLRGFDRCIMQQRRLQQLQRRIEAGTGPKSIVDRNGPTLVSMWHHGKKLFIWLLRMYLIW